MPFTQGQFADLLGVTRQAVSKAVKAGRIRVNEAGQITEREARRILRAERRKVEARLKEAERHARKLRKRLAKMQ